MKHEQKPNAFTIPVRIYYEDTDAGGVVYYANYLKFLERCRTEWLRAIGHDPASVNGWDELVSGKIQIICVNAAQMKITSIPAPLRTKLEALQ